MHTVSDPPRARRWRIVLVAVVVVLIVIGAGTAIGLRAAAAAQLPVPAETQSEVLREARDFWDNPVERAGYLSMAITGINGRNICLTYTVTAYTLFGLPASRIDINCHGTVRVDP